MQQQGYAAAHTHCAIALSHGCNATMELRSCRSHCQEEPHLVCCHSADEVVVNRTFVHGSTLKQYLQTPRRHICEIGPTRYVVAGLLPFVTTGCSETTTQVRGRSHLRAPVDVKMLQLYLFQGSSSKIRYRANLPTPATCTHILNSAVRYSGLSQFISSLSVIWLSSALQVEG